MLHLNKVNFVFDIYVEIRNIFTNIGFQLEKVFTSKYGISVTNR